MRAKFLIILAAAVAAFSARADGGERAMVTALQGGVTKLAPGNPQPLQAFVKLKQGDLLALDKSARVQVVYFESGRQETWQGGGRLEITGAGGVAYGLAEPQVKTLPLIMVKQIAKTPSLESQGRTGMMRLRAVAVTPDVAKIQETYQRLRAEAEPGDLAPELYLLSSLFEARDLDRVERALADLEKARPGDQEAAQLVALYRKAVKGAREAADR